MAAPITTSLAQCLLLYMRDAAIIVAPPYMMGAMYQVDFGHHFAVDDVGLAAGMRDGDVADLVALWVDPAARGTGAADALVAAVLDWARGEGVATVRLHVTAGNATAERLYARHGFAPTGAVYVRERDGRDVVELEASL